MRNERGITLVALVITIMVLAILLSVAVHYGRNYLDIIQFQDFEYEMKQIQGKVNVLHEKITMGENQYITLGQDVTTSSRATAVLKIITGVDYSNIEETERKNYYYNDTDTYYRYLTEDNVKSLLEISSNPGDMIINFVTREVISVQGCTYKGRTYYSLEQM